MPRGVYTERGEILRLRLRMTRGEGLAMTKNEAFVMTKRKVLRMASGQPLEIDACAGIIEEESFAERLG